MKNLRISLVILLIISGCKEELVPTVKTADIISIGQTTAVCGGEVISEGTSNAVVKGICWSTSSSPTIEDSNTIDGSGLGPYSSNLIDLKSGTEYYVRAYAINNIGTGYGELKSFTTEPPSIPEIITLNVYPVTETTATSGGKIILDGTSPITDCGLCWSTSENPTLSDNYLSFGIASDNFTITISGLEAGTSYYLRAYATNSAGIGYGNSYSFTTNLNGNSVPDFSTMDFDLEIFQCLVPTDDGFLLAGINDSKVCITKLDANFNTIWEKDNYEWGTIVEGEGWGMGSSYYVTINNMFINNEGNIACFYTTESGNDVIYHYNYVAELDNSGNEIKNTKISFFRKVIRTSDNGYLLLGVYSLTKLSHDLTNIWENNEASEFRFTSHTNTMDNGSAVTGGSQNVEKTSVLIKFTKNGILQWIKTDFNQNPNQDYGYDILEMPDGGYFIVGRTIKLQYPSNVDCMIIRTEISGDTLWTKKFGDSDNEWLNEIIYSSPEFIIVKEQVGYPNDANRKTVVLKIAHDGQILNINESLYFEKLIYCPSEYFIAVIKNNDQTIKLLKLSFEDIFH